jgi:cellulose synthase operon protein C
MRKPMGSEVTSIYVPNEADAKTDAKPKAAAAPAAKAKEPKAATPSVPPKAEVQIVEAPRAQRAELSPQAIVEMLKEGEALSSKGKKAEAYERYRAVLNGVPSHPEALTWIEDYLRSKKEYAELRDVLLSAVRAPGAGESVEIRKERLREIAALCDSQLRDVDGAVNVLRQLLSLDRTDEAARSSLTRLLERTQRWEDLATLLEKEASVEPNIENKIQLEKKLARLHEEKRKDPTAAADAWVRIARLRPEDDSAILSAVKLWLSAKQPAAATEALSDHLSLVETPASRGMLLEKQGQIFEEQGNFLSAGDALAEAADTLRNGRLWEDTERLYVAAQAWNKAAQTAGLRGQFSGESKQHAAHLARASEHLQKVPDREGALRELEGASSLDPENDKFADAIRTQLEETREFERLAAVLVRRSERVERTEKRVSIRREAARIFAEHLRERDRARDLWLRVLEDGEDEEALEALTQDAIEGGDYNDAASLLRRLSNALTDKTKKTRAMLREAELLAGAVGDAETAILRYEDILEHQDENCRAALVALADLHQARKAYAEASQALERDLKLAGSDAERSRIALRLSRLYEQLEDPRQAIRSLDIARIGEPDNDEARAKLAELCEATGQWSRVADLLAEIIELEADEAEAAVRTLRLSDILVSKLDRGDEGLTVLTEFADSGIAAVRNAYVALGDALNRRELVARKLVEWWQGARNSPERTAALVGAFERFINESKPADALRVGLDLLTVRPTDKELASASEKLAVGLRDRDALSICHEVLLRETTGGEAAQELVRQAEVMNELGIAKRECIAHGEESLNRIPCAESEPLLSRLADISGDPDVIVELYERHVSRTKTQPERLGALARAAQIASIHGKMNKLTVFLELALTGTPSEGTVNLLEESAREADETEAEAPAKDGEEQPKVAQTRMQAAFAEALSRSGLGARDGGRTRAYLLRKAARIARSDLKDRAKAFTWLGDSLIAFVEEATLFELSELGAESKQFAETEAVLTRALGEIFDGPLVRMLLRQRADLRNTVLGDRAGAATDLKRLHDLSPGDHGVFMDLAKSYLEQGQFRPLVAVYEDQILRGRDPIYKAELAELVAKLWEEKLHDMREAADAWRRVLRMKPGNEAAQAGLERAKKGPAKDDAAKDETKSDTAKSEAPSDTTNDASEPKTNAESEGALDGYLPKLIPEQPAPKSTASMPPARDRVSSVIPTGEAPKKPSAPPLGARSRPPTALAEVPVEIPAAVVEDARPKLALSSPVNMGEITFADEAKPDMLDALLDRQGPRSVHAAQMALKQVDDDDIDRSLERLGESTRPAKAADQTDAHHVSLDELDAALARADGKHMPIPDASEEAIDVDDLAELVDDEAPDTSA